MILFEYDNEVRLQGNPIICGIDEAGRGPLAGPVVAAAVIFPDDVEIEGLNDSKKISEKKRDILYPIIMQKCLAYGIGYANPKEIDEVNILNATYLAMGRALDEIIEKATIKPDLLLVDGNGDPRLGLPTRTVIKGDATSASIAAASILAKVSRDRLMIELDSEYPGYDLAKHKGYPTKQHYQSITELGISEIHRLSFLKKMY